ncbi:F-box protein At3g12350-like [Primulina tabacum]|uniref:F-box protein At3g12350-like n=1 Tax=Primulina tabacum TaxID=48773 RepID=UPI003F59F74C
MEPILPLSFIDFPEDVQLCVISFLHQLELEAFASTSKKYFDLCNNDERLWFLKCSHRWGSQTQIKNWGGGKISYRNLFRLLNQYENLIGCWIYDYISAGYSKLVLFEWGPFYITGNRVLPSQHRGYDVIKKPFLWITATSDGQTLNFLDRDETLSLTEKDLFREDSEKLRGTELILVDIDLLDNRCLWLRENRQFSEFRKLVHAGNGREEYEIVYRSPPDGLMAQIKEILASKAGVGDIPLSKKERRTERQREREKQRDVRRWRSQRFQKLTNHSPTPSRQLQGLWKGIGPDKMLNLYLVSYGERFDSIYGEIVGNSSRFLIAHDSVFTSRASAFTESPISSEEEHTYSTRTHLRPIVISNQAEQDRSAAPFGDEYLDVLRMFYAISPLFSYHGFDDGRIWLYADGTFGFGFLGGNCIVDLKPLLKNGHLLDAIA